MGFGPPEATRRSSAALDVRRRARRDDVRAAGHATGSYAVDAAADDPFIHQEMIEILYHTLWETVHVFFEHRELGHDVGDAGFLYPFLGRTKQDTARRRRPRSPRRSG